MPLLACAFGQWLVLTSGMGHSRRFSISAILLVIGQFRTRRLAVDGETPLLPGTTMLYRDGVFMGQGYLPMLSPGEEAKLGFGADDLIKVKRVEVKRQIGEEGIITSSNVDTRAYDISVKNLHDFTVPVTILDQTPNSEMEDIVVSKRSLA